MSQNSEYIYYNALQVALDGNYDAISRLRRANDSWENSWLTLTSQKQSSIDPEKEWKKLAAHEITLVLLDDPDYPPLLKEIPLAPFGIYVRGSLAPDPAHALAIVGTRRAMPSGKATARKFGKAAGEANITVVSGLALGIDGAAHVGCLEGKGVTVAVLAGGLDSIYPKTHEPLGDRILENGGALVSEYPPGSPSYPNRFLERNRIVSGFSHGTLLIEAPARSGSLATARFALEQNRAVFVTPGPLGHPNFAGSHALLRSGAEFVTEPVHVLESLGVENLVPAVAGLRHIREAGPEELAVLEILREAREALEIDKIIEASKLEPQTVIRTLTFLAIKNAVKETAAGYELIQ